MNKINISKKLQDLTIQQKLGQLFLTNFQGKYEIPQEIHDLNNEGLLGGIIYFSGSNVDNPEQLRSLGQKIQNMVLKNPIDIPYFITLDQEGGQLSALHRDVAIFPGNMALGQANDSELSKKYGKYTGELLSYCNININFAPVIDVAHEVNNGVHRVDNRMLHSDVETVTKNGVAIIEGLQDAGVMACAKHYPGMKISEKDTHHQMDIIDYTPEEMEKYYFPPFKEAVKAGVEAIMTHHGVYPAYDDKPATLSKVLLDYLRFDLGFTGLIITDDLVMKAVQDVYPAEQACELAINAGVDQIIITGGGRWLIDSLANKVKNGQISETTIDEALVRIWTAKNKYITEKEFSALPPDRIIGESLAKKISRKSISVEKNEGVLPLKIVSENTKVSVILANPARLVMSDTVNFYDISLKSVIEKEKMHPYVKEVIMPWTPTPEEILSCFDIGFISDVLIFTTVNAYRFTDQLEILKQIHSLKNNGSGPIIISVATRSPDDVELLKPYSDVVLCSNGLTPIQIHCLIEKIFGIEL